MIHIVTVFQTPSHDSSYMTADTFQRSSFWSWVSGPPPWQPERHSVASPGTSSVSVRIQRKHTNKWQQQWDESLQKVCATSKSQTAYSEGRTEHLFFFNLFAHTVEVSSLLVHSVFQTVHHLLFVPPFSLCVFFLDRRWWACCPCIVITIKHYTVAKFLTFRA